MLADPVAREMNHTQWMFELQSLAQQDERKYKDTEVLIKIARKMAIDLLGLNMMPTKEVVVDKGSGEEITRLRNPKEGEIIPLSILTGREELISEILSSYQELLDQNVLDDEIAEEIANGSTGPTLEDLEKIEQEFEDDLEFIEADPLSWASAQDRFTLEQQVGILPKSEEVKNDKPLKKAKVRLN